MNPNRDEDYIDLLEILKVFRKHWLLFISLVVICAAVSFGYTKFFVDETFKANSTIIIVKDETTSNNNSFSYSDVQLSQKLASTYTQILRSEAVSDDVIANLGINMTSAAYANAVDITAVDNTEVIKITVTTKDPKLSADMANEIVNVFQKKIQTIMHVDNVTVLNKAKVPSKKSGPSVMKRTLFGGAIGFALFAMYAVIFVLMDTKVKTAEDIKEILGFPVIGTISEITVKKGRK